MPAAMVASSFDAAYWPRRYSRTYVGTMALPLTALTRSLRTTTPEKSRLILKSRSPWGVLVSKPSFSIALIPGPFPSEIKVGRKRPLQGVAHLAVGLPLGGV